MWNDNLWKLTESCCHERADSSHAGAQGIMCYALTPYVCRSTCHGTEFCFCGLWLVLLSSFLSLFMNMKVSRAVPADSWLLVSPFPSVTVVRTDLAIHQITATVSQMLFLSLLTTSRVIIWSTPLGLCVSKCQGRKNKEGRERFLQKLGIAVVLAPSRPLYVALSILHSCCCLLGDCWEQWHTLTNEWWKRFGEPFHH